MENYIKISRKVFLFIYRSVVKCFITIPMCWYSNLQWHIIKGQFKDIGSNVQIAFPFCGYGLENISIGDNFLSGERLKLRTFGEWEGVKYTPQIKIGNNVNIQTDCHISAINSVVIGDNVLIASFVYISDHSHGTCDYSELFISPIKRRLYSKGDDSIGKNVWIGEKATILPGVTIGEGSIIGANSVVTKNIPPYSIACGIPAKVIKKLK